MLIRIASKLVFALLLILPSMAEADGPAPGAPVDQADTAAIQAVIAHQLGAFLHDDGQAAFADASPSIQQMFHDPDTFMEMVKTGYLPVYRSSHVEFRDLGMIDGKLIQQVYMVGPDGVAVLALYEMQRQPDGSWRINGCAIARAPDQGA
jgi:hypothetical protein